ncbi:Glutathione S-transferase 1, isoform C [Halotydeus destructor]|nr:Glutathione S-transferase 1, isoform C [Halotydeus destructor]
MTIDFYYMPASAPCRAVIMTAKALGVELNLKELNLMAGEHLKPEFVAINPQHCIPTVHDTESGLALWESRAICAYLVNKYAPGNALYPECPAKRAKVDQLLYFDIGTLYKALGEVIYPPLFYGKEVEEGKEQVFKDKLTLLDGFLNGQKYVAGDTLTIADLSILAGISFLAISDYDLSAYANIVAWQANLEQELPYHKEVNVDPVNELKAALAARSAAK